METAIAPDVISTPSLVRPWALRIGTPVGGVEAEDFAIVEACSRFYGFDTVACRWDELPEHGGAWSEAPVAVVIGADLLAVWSNLAPQIRGLLRGVPLLILGANAGTDKEALRQATGGAVHEIVPLRPALPASIRLSANRATAGPLAGQRIPAPAEEFYGLELAAGKVPTEVVACVNGVTEEDAMPCCVRITLADRVVWVAAASAGQSGGWHFERAHFGRRPHIVTLVLMFLRTAGKDACWHAPVRFANLCIDDPRLTEPYGRLSYPKLLAEAQSAGFHATIGFVPWNYDRHSPDVVELARKNCRWLSFAVHGNNHDSFEFYGPQRWRERDPWRVKGLAEQEGLLRQALRRMDEFSAVTGLIYDRVMVFPHKIGSAGTLRLLKSLGFAGTANYDNHPLGSPPQIDLADCLSAVNSDAAGLPAIRRDYPKNRPEWSTALDLFLDNPILFMAHEDLFEPGSAAFNETASLLARLEPAVRWASLGEIFRGLYRQRRLRADLWEVKMLADEIDLYNESPAWRRYTARREDPHDPAMTNVTVDGADAAWERRGAAVVVSTRLAPGQTCRIKVKRQAADSVAGPVELRRRGLRNRLFRAVAETRDMWLSRWRPGRWLTRRYYGAHHHRARWFTPLGFLRILRARSEQTPKQVDEAGGK